MNRSTIATRKTTCTADPPNTPETTMNLEKYTLVSSDGRVFSTKSMRILKPMRCGQYLAVGIYDASGKTVRRYVHRLVLELATAVVPGDLEARHLDGNRDNNSEFNLRWGTREENAADKARHGTSPVGERNAMAKLTANDVVAIRAAVAAGATQRSQCAIYGVSPMTINRAVRNQCWVHV